MSQISHWTTSLTFSQGFFCINCRINEGRQKQSPTICSLSRWRRIRQRISSVIDLIISSDTVEKQRTSPERGSLVVFIVGRLSLNEFGHRNETKKSIEFTFLFFFSLWTTKGRRSADGKPLTRCRTANKSGSTSSKDKNPRSIRRTFFKRTGKLFSFVSRENISPEEIRRSSFLSIGVVRDQQSIRTPIDIFKQRFHFQQTIFDLIFGRSIPRNFLVFVSRKRAKSIFVSFVDSSKKIHSFLRPSPDVKPTNLFAWLRGNLVLIVNEFDLFFDLGRRNLEFLWFDDRSNVDKTRKHRLDYSSASSNKKRNVDERRLMFQLSAHLDDNRVWQISSAIHRSTRSNLIKQICVGNHPSRVSQIYDGQSRRLNFKVKSNWGLCNERCLQRWVDHRLSEKKNLRQTINRTEFRRKSETSNRLSFSELLHCFLVETSDLCETLHWENSRLSQRLFSSELVSRFVFRFE